MLRLEIYDFTTEKLLRIILTDSYTINLEYGYSLSICNCNSLKINSDLFNHIKNKGEYNLKLYTDEYNRIQDWSIL